MKINIEAPINPVSFGNVAVNILFELFKRQIDVNLFLIGQQPDFSSFDKLPENFKQWCLYSCQKAIKDYSKDDVALKIWHINGSHNRVARRQLLYTFNECDRLTDYEVNLLRNQTKTFVSSPYNLSILEKSGIDNGEYIPLGFDANHFNNIGKRLVPDNVTAFGLFGKWEKRKSTLEVIKAWIKQYGNNPKYVLHAAVYNPFFQPEQNKQLQMQSFEGKNIWNVNFLPFVQTNTEYNQVLNSVDIVLGMSKSECFGLPEFQTVAIGKHAVIHNAAGYQSWANKHNSILVESSGKEDVYDGIFFAPNQPFNQGQYFSWNEGEFLEACKQAELVYNMNPTNKNGLLLQKEFTWEKTVNRILEFV